MTCLSVTITDVSDIHNPHTYTLADADTVIRMCCAEDDPYVSDDIRAIAAGTCQYTCFTYDTPSGTYMYEVTASFNDSYVET